MDYAQLYPCIALQSRGRIGKWWIHKEYKTFKVVTKYYYPEQPRTGKQQGWKSVFYDAVYNWRGFDTATKNFYNQLKRPAYMSGYNRYLRLYLEANYLMIIYWGTLEKSATEPAKIPDYISSDYFTAGLYPPAAKELVALGPSGDLVLPAGLRLPGPLAITAQPSVSVVLSADFSIADASWTDVDWGAETWDDGDMWEGVTNPERLTIKIPGTYLVIFKVRWSTNFAADRCIIRVKKNATEVMRFERGLTAAAYDDLIIVRQLKLAKDEYLTAGIYQNSGAAKDISSAYSFFQATKIA